MALFERSDALAHHAAADTELLHEIGLARKLLAGLATASHYVRDQNLQDFSVPPSHTIIKSRRPAPHKVSCADQAYSSISEEEIDVDAEAPRRATLAKSPREGP